ncbi:HlyD family secretion protein [Hyphomicrobium sp.]|uniref:HlyD family secretion protein n=1 Tax=Hyphomicrobium sp. TaxID=82 RepID=UPI002D78935B|nr:HlyD family secretion protein [Hyphomicrobium sp.]HET6389845.1 HlyD family secretion protein [Hyphomicrobium sp.]
MADVDTKTPKAAQKATPVAADDRPKHPVLRRALLLLGPIVAIAVGIWLYLGGGTYVSEDDSYVHSANVAINPQISGQVTRVAVQPNEVVKKGQLLFEIDPQPFQITLDEAKANLASVSEKLRGLVATYKQDQADIAQANANVTYAKQEFDRVNTLVRDGVDDPAQLDKARQQLRDAQASVRAAESVAASVLAQLGGSLDVPIEQHATYLAAKAKVALAERNLRLTRILAPFAGTAARVENIQPGSYLTVGQNAFTLIGLDTWIIANIKETDLTHIKEGDRATVVLDSYPDQTLEAKVQSITPASGSVFALIPAENASGNWVKVVQRMPVRVIVTKLDPNVVMRDGASATVTVDTGYHRTLQTLWRDIKRTVGMT